jgi:hypothetical protein
MKIMTSARPRSTSTREDDAVASGVLRLVQRAIGARQHVRDVAHPPAVGRYSYAGGRFDF